MTTTKPSLRTERALLRADRQVIAGMDEVGRGALAGPVTVGVVFIDVTTKSAPVGLRDSKLLTPAARQRLVPKVRRWALAHGVGHASAEEIDQIGIIAALRAAGRRALTQAGLTPDLVVLDGNHNWLCPRAGGDFDTLPMFGQEWSVPTVDVMTMIKADLRCSSVAAASVLAKTTRDAMMVEAALAHPGYEWEINKGYATPGHQQALRDRGPSVLHRQSWRLPEPNEQTEPWELTEVR